MKYRYQDDRHSLEITLQNGGISEVYDRAMDMQLTPDQQFTPDQQSYGYYVHPFTMECICINVRNRFDRDSPATVEVGIAVWKYSSAQEIKEYDTLAD